MCGFTSKNISVRALVPELSLEVRGGLSSPLPESATSAKCLGFTCRISHYSLEGQRIRLPFPVSNTGDTSPGSPPHSTSQGPESQATRCGEVALGGVCLPGLPDEPPCLRLAPLQKRTLGVLIRGRGRGCRCGSTVTPMHSFCLGNWCGQTGGEMGLAPFCI